MDFTQDTVSELTINEAAQDLDVRIEGEADKNLFFTDGSVSRVGIGMNTPTRKLHVSGNIWASGSNGHITASGNISASAASTSSFGRIIVADGMYHAGDEDTFINFPTGDKVDVKAGGINFMRVWQKDSDDDKIYFNWNEEEMDVIFRTKQNNPGLVISGSGQVGIGGESNPAEALVVMGNISASGELIGTINGGSF